jgi:hypothetical protein
MGGKVKKTDMGSPYSGINIDLALKKFTICWLARLWDLPYPCKNVFEWMFRIICGGQKKRLGWYSWFVD